MLRKVHRRLTFLCAGITSLILVTMSCLSLSISEDSLNKSQYLSFQRDMSTLASDFKQLTVITHEWLSRLETGGLYQVYVTDNGIPFLFNSKISHTVKEEEYLEIRHYYETAFKSAKAEAGTGNKLRQDLFSYTASTGSRFYVCCISLPGIKGTTELMVLSPLTRLDTQIHEQRLLYFWMNLAAICCLLLFSWLFTRLLLAPVEKNRKQQVQFIAAASHELRAPLAVILSCVSASKKASPDEREGFLGTIENEGLRMNKLINDMLLLSQADNHTFHIHLEAMEADTKLIDLYEGFLPMAKERQITLDLHLPVEAFLPCLCDEVRFCQVITVLLHNAISYTPEGGHILLSLLPDTPAAGKFTIAVADNGDGIPDDEKENIFQRFYRMDSSRWAKDHSGLGLSIAAEIVRALNGSITVTDTPGGGSTFLVVLSAQEV